MGGQTEFKVGYSVTATGDRSREFKASFLTSLALRFHFFFFLLDLVLCTGKEIWSSPDTAMTKPIRRGRPDVPARVNLRRNLGLGTPE
jgi:hypothetical protein